MKKPLMAFCCAALALAAIAEPKAATPARKAPNAPNANQGFPQFQNGAFPMPTIFKIDGNTTAQQVKDFKKQICDKVDAAFKAKSAKTGEEKQPTTIIFFVNEGGFGGLGGMMGQGFGGPGAGGMPGGMAPNTMPGAPAR